MLFSDSHLSFQLSVENSLRSNTLDPIIEKYMLGLQVISAECN